MPIINLTGLKLIFPNGELEQAAEALNPVVKSSASEDYPHLRVIDHCYLEWVRNGRFIIERDTLYIVSAEVYMSVVLAMGPNAIHFAYPYFKDIDWDEGTVKALVVDRTVSQSNWHKRWGDIVSNLFST